jgi:hypothetical protein
MRGATRIVVLALVAVAASAGAALSAGGGPISAGAVEVCVHQNGGALVAAAHCGGNDSAVSLLTSTGTAANASLLDGLGASSFARSGVVTQSDPGFVRLDCSRSATQDVQLTGFGTLIFYCLPNGVPAVQLLGDASFFGLMTTSKSDTIAWAPGDLPQQALSMAFTGVPEGYFVQARQVASNAITLTVQGSIVREINSRGAPYDILYSATEQ